MYATSTPGAAEPSFFDWPQDLNFWAGLWDVSVSVLIPVGAILVAARIATRQTRSTVYAQLRAVALERRVQETAQAQLRDQATTRGVLAVSRALNRLGEAAFVGQVREQAKLRVQATAEIPEIALSFGQENESVTNWILAELGVAASALDDTDEYGIPVVGDVMTWRTGYIIQRVTEWAMGSRPTAWFEGREHPPVLESKHPKDWSDEE